MYIKYPRAELRSDYYLQPFDINLWFALLLIILIGSISAIAVESLKTLDKRCFIDNMYFGYESFCNQCGNHIIENTTLREISILLRITAIIVLALYGATITSFLSVEVLKTPFRNFEEFLNQREYKLLAKKNNIMEVGIRFEYFANILNLYVFYSSRAIISWRTYMRNYKTLVIMLH